MIRSTRPDRRDASRASVALAAVALLAACAVPAERSAAPAADPRAGAPAVDAAKVVASRPVEAAKAARRPDDAPNARLSRMVVDAGGKAFRVNIKEVAMIGKTVIAVREGDAAASEDWTTLTLPMAGAGAIGADVPFPDSAYERLAVDIAKRVAAMPAVCGEGQALALSRAPGGDVSRMYRQSHRAWVIFGNCEG